MNGLPQPSYVMSEPHLSGYRVIIGYETLADAQAAQLTLSKPQAREEAQPVAWIRAQDLRGLEESRQRGRDDHTTVYLAREPRGYVEEPRVALYTTPPAPEAEKLRAEIELLEEVCARYADDEDAFLSNDGEPFGSITTECGMKARSARARFKVRLAARQQEGR